MRSSTNDIDWEDVYWDSMPRLYNFFLYRFTDRTAAEDLTSITFEKAWQYRDQYQEARGSVTVWLFGIARHVGIDYLRQHQRHLPLEMVDAFTSAESVEEQVSEALSHQHDLNYLAILLRRLNAREQELIALKYGGGLTNRAIAQVVGLSESNVGTILFRIIKQFRESWEIIYHE